VLFRPRGAVAALESTASSITDTWTPNRVMNHSDPRPKALDPARQVMKGEWTRGGGTQYLVADTFQMERIVAPPSAARATHP
jgi:hypothetical protein